MAPRPEREFKSPLREYVVLEQQDDGEGPFYVEVLRVEARNATNALRAAFKQLAKRSEQDTFEATLVVVTASMWTPTPVTASVEPKVTVTIGS